MDRFLELFTIAMCAVAFIIWTAVIGNYLAGVAEGMGWRWPWRR